MMCSQEPKAPVSEAESNSVAVDVIAKADEQTSESRKVAEETAPSEAEVSLKEANPNQEEKTVEGNSSVVVESSMTEKQAPVDNEAAKHPVEESSAKPSETVATKSVGTSVETLGAPADASEANPTEAPARIPTDNLVEPSAPIIDTPVTTTHASQPKRSSHPDDNSDDEYTSDYLEVSSKRRRRETRSCTFG